MGQITTHILDTALGQPAEGVPVKLSRRDAGGWLLIGEGITDNDGRVADLVSDDVLPEGIYQMRFDTGKYCHIAGPVCFYPWVEVVFQLTGEQHYHIPLLLSPFGYSTYRGS